MSRTEQNVPARRQWTAPRVECLETRPEVSAYSGVGDPWHRQPR
ncbi:hypothetical protein GCM10010399_77140 [Dactylosporangium fulvum]|uniref:Coenzyme PQQ synthesis protein A n=1 Tax=Dactylosporangium fulvum TaxID=53359 RepID=A0ABY5W523_9ACTN|nr:hypothetical protein [Dactylosporangium fulvum]UWP85090.1 hypothetical protein Dfulv_13010 [Dactylosporangium fulvum]